MLPIPVDLDRNIKIILERIAVSGLHRAADPQIERQLDNPGPGPQGQHDDGPADHRAAHGHRQHPRVDAPGERHFGAGRARRRCGHEPRLCGAERVAHKLSESLRQTAFTFDAQPLRVTLSAGVVEVNDGQGERALRLADANLYAAKKAGRDQLVASAA